MPLISSDCSTKLHKINEDNGLRIYAIFQQSVVKYEASLVVLRAVEFFEDNALSEIGITKTCLVLKRNDPGLL